MGTSVRVHVSSEEKEGGEPAFMVPCLNFSPSIDGLLLSSPPEN